MVRIYREIEAEIQKVVLTGRQRLVWVMLALSLLSLSACNNPVPSASPQLVEGQAFPSFMLNYVLGENATKRTFQGKVLILNDWSSPEMLALLEHIHETKRGADVRN